MRRIHAFTIAALLIAASTAATSPARAFSVAVHIYLANAIHDELARNLDATGRPLIRLMSPDGTVSVVELDARDAMAILESPEFFRGGAIGPDNTVMTGLTDPSHAWMFRPFQQCGALYDEALAEERRQIAAGTPEAALALEERAYALGCFLHGITDNNAHHAVNFFTGETFTLYPIDSASGGTLQFSLLNVVRHIVTETRFQDGLETQDAALGAGDRGRPGVMSTPLTPDALRHRIAAGLVARVYFDRGDGGPNDLWQGFAGDLIEGKRAALRAALGLGPTDDIVVALSSSPDPFTDDVTAVTAYVGYLRDGGLTPADYILILPEIVRDIGRLYSIVNVQGREAARTISSLRFVEKRCLDNAFAPRDAMGEVNWDALGPSSFEQVMALKTEQLEMVIPAYLQAIENISNLNLTVGLIHTTREQRLEALRPLTDVIEAITDIHYEILFSATTREIIDNVQYVRDAIQAVLDLIKMRVREFVIERVMTYLDDLRAEGERLLMEVVDALDEDIRMTYDRLRTRVQELRDAAIDEQRRAALARIGVDLESDTDFFDGFMTSALFMNAYNSAAGALAQQEVVGARASGMFDGPVSFDASYQVEYNQLAICEELRPVFYPCGISAGEMLQPDYRHCVTLPEIAGELQPAVECHDGSSIAFADMASSGACAPIELDAFLEEASPSGSYSLAFPPSAAALGGAVPTCSVRVPYATETVPPGTDGGIPVPDGGAGGGVDAGPGGGGGSGSGDGGCGCITAGSRPAGSGMLVLAVGLLALGVVSSRARPSGRCRSGACRDR